MIRNDKHKLNLNKYRNWHHQLSNKIKRKYTEEIKWQLLTLPFIHECELFFTFYPEDRRIRDRANVLSIHEKFFCDALKKHGKIKDDCDKYIRASHYFTGDLDKLNPRVEIEIRYYSKLH
jgi:hypothetical protein